MKPSVEICGRTSGRSPVSVGTGNAIWFARSTPNRRANENVSRDMFALPPLLAPDTIAGMTYALLAFVSAFAAFYIWLGVRIINRRERWAKWALVMTPVGVPVLYVLSFGPACWWFSSAMPSYAAEASDWQMLTYGSTVPARAALVAPTVYWPFGWLAQNAPRPVQKAVVWYANRNGKVALPIDRSGRHWANWQALIRTYVAISDVPSRSNFSTTLLGGRHYGVAPLS